MRIHVEDHFGDMAAIALEKLRTGEIDDDFRTIAHDLTLTNEYPALTEGTLLMVGGTLHETKQAVAEQQAKEASSEPEGEIDVEGRDWLASPKSQIRNALTYLALAQGDIMRNGLRPIGRQILDYCVELSIDLDEEVTTVLVGLQGFDRDAPSAN